MVSSCLFRKIHILGTLISCWNLGVLGKLNFFLSKASFIHYGYVLNECSIHYSSSSLFSCSQAENRSTLAINLANTAVTKTQSWDHFSRWKALPMFRVSPSGCQPFSPSYPLPSPSSQQITSCKLHLTPRPGMYFEMAWFDTRYDYATLEIHAEFCLSYYPGVASCT